MTYRHVLASLPSFALGFIGRLEHVPDCEFIQELSKLVTAELYLWAEDAKSTLFPADNLTVDQAKALVRFLSELD